MALDRRTALKALVATGVGVATGSVAYGAGYERHHLATITRDIPVSGLPAELDGLRIGLVTDVHHSAMVPPEDVMRAVAQVRAAAPDLVVLGGDYVSFADPAFMDPVAELLAPLTSAPQGAFAVLGNHDDDRLMPAALARQDITVLRDQRTSLTIRGARLDLAGIRFWTRKPAEIASVLEGRGETTIVLAHDPRRLAEAAALDAQVVLSGHTHGGQVLVPGVGAIAGRKFPVLAGYATRENTRIFVSRGVGTVYVPVRINCPPDVAILTLRRESDI
ncbi:MAG: metallophosphoesterase [Vicinamibacterales bacterium]